MRYFIREIFTLIRSPIFLTLTFLGNLTICMAGTIFYYMERSQNPSVKHVIDGIWWSFATATTTGYGDIVPVTYSGKVLGIFLMLIGLALFAMFTGLFAEIILTSARNHRSSGK